MNGAFIGADAILVVYVQVKKTAGDVGACCTKQFLGDIGLPK